jgi:hypothetical protein
VLAVHSSRSARVVLGGSAAWLVVTRPFQSGEGLLQQPGQAAHVPSPAGPPFRLQLRRITEPRDQTRINVLVRLPRPEQVIQQPADVLVGLSDFRCEGFSSFLCCPFLGDLPRTPLSGPY